MKEANRKIKCKQVIWKLPVYTCTRNNEDYITVTRKHLIMLRQALRYTNAYISVCLRGSETLQQYNILQQELLCTSQYQRNVRDKVGSIGIQNVPSGMQQYIQIEDTSITLLHLPRVYIKSFRPGTNICA